MNSGIPQRPLTVIWIQFFKCYFFFFSGDKKKSEEGRKEKKNEKKLRIYL